MAEYCRTIFGDALLIDPLEKYPVGSSAQTHTHPASTLGGLAGASRQWLSCRFCVSWSPDSRSPRPRSCWARSSSKTRRSTVTTGPPTAAASGGGSRGSSRRPTTVSRRRVPRSEASVATCSHWLVFGRRLSPERQRRLPAAVQRRGEAVREADQRPGAPQVPGWVVPRPRSG